MTTTKMRALAILSISSPVTINELSLYALTEQSTMSRTLDALEEQGLIVRKPRPEDLRVRDVDITEAGRDAFARVWPTMYDASAQKMLDGVDEEEYKAFTATLHKIASPIIRQVTASEGCAGAAQSVAIVFNTPSSAAPISSAKRPLQAAQPFGPSSRAARAWNAQP